MAAKQLRIARGFSLDADYIGGRSLALIAKRGAGKSYTARVMAEEFWAAKVPFVFLDPMGTAWGLRSSADGNDEGIPVAVFGGEHADAPLERTGGKLMADLVVDEGLSMILDLSEFGSRAAERQFAHDFLDRLYRRNRDLVHLLMDEADLFAPQSPQQGDKPLLGVTENIVRRGRNRGIGITLITQRPAVLNKDVLTQVDGLVAMRLIGLNDRKVIDEWLKGHGDDLALAATVKDTLAGLDTGAAWWWIPEQGVLERVQVRRTHTFDSSPTKQRGGEQREPKTYADVDMGAIEQRIAATLERAKAEDPRELRAEVARLKRELSKRPTEKVTETVTETVEVPVLDDGQTDALRELVDGLGEHAGRIIAAANEIGTGLRKVTGHGQRVAPPAPAPRQPSAAPPRRQPRPEPREQIDGDFTLMPAHRKILDALAEMEQLGIAPADRTQLALFVGVSPKSGGYFNNLGRLRSAGLIAYPMPATVGLTDEGRDHADTSRVPSTVEELHERMRALVGPARSLILNELIEVYPDALAKDELAERIGKSPTSGGYFNDLGKLRSLGLIDYPQPGTAAALPVLFLDAAA